MIKDVKFFGEVGLQWLLTDIEVGDLVRVQYRDTSSYESGWDEEVYLGFISATAEVTTENPAGLMQMWCITTGSNHIIRPKLDKIEVVSKAGKEKK